MFVAFCLCLCLAVLILKPPALNLDFKKLLSYPKGCNLCCTMLQEEFLYIQKCNSSTVSFYSSNDFICLYKGLRSTTFG